MPKRSEAENHEKKIIPKEVIPEGLLELATLGVNYARLKKEEVILKEDLTKQNKIIKDKLSSSSFYELNGSHKEVYAPLGDGLNEVFIQVQLRQSVSVVDDVIPQLRAKVGDKIESFILTKEVLHDNALEAMRNQGLITHEDILGWTTVKETESLIVKVNKKRK